MSDYTKRVKTDNCGRAYRTRIFKSFCSDDETIGLVQEIYGTKVNKGICCVFRYNNLPAKNVLPEYVCDYKKRAGLFQRSAVLD